jgi:hypothetical protein
MTDETSLQHARDAASYAAWLDIFARFTPGQRKTLANLFAHNWTIASVELESTHGDRETFAGEVPRVEALRDNFERLKRQHPARLQVYRAAK